MKLNLRFVVSCFSNATYVIRPDWSTGPFQKKFKLTQMKKMAEVAAVGEPDSGSVRIAPDTFPLTEPTETRSSRHLTRAAALTAVSAVLTTPRPDSDNDTENVTTNFESPIESVIFKCDQCDNYESTSQSALLAHIAHCHSTREAEPEVATTPKITIIKPENNNIIPTTVQAAATPGGTPDRPHRKLFECDVCNMKFSNGANMRRHRMRHTGVKPYECRVCQKRFFRKDHLAEHFTTHTKTLPYHCPICNRGFQRQIAMRAHFQNEHVGQHDLVKSCPLCSYRAGSMKSLRVHFFNRYVFNFFSNK